MRAWVFHSITLAGLIIGPFCPESWWTWTSGIWLAADVGDLAGRTGSQCDGLDRPLTGPADIMAGASFPYIVWRLGRAGHDNRGFAVSPDCIFRDRVHSGMAERDCGKWDVSGWIRLTNGAR